MSEKHIVTYVPVLFESELTDAAKHLGVYRSDLVAIVVTAGVRGSVDRGKQAIGAVVDRGLEIYRERSNVKRTWTSKVVVRGSRLAFDPSLIRSCADTFDLSESKFVAALTLYELRFFPIISGIYGAFSSLEV